MTPYQLKRYLKIIFFPDKPLFGSVATINGKNLSTIPMYPSIS